MRLFILLTFYFSCTFIADAQEAQKFTEQQIFSNGTDGYNCYRIPAIITAKNGDLLAFAEGRVLGCNDFGNVDIVLKRSTDQGKTWSAIQVVADNGTMQSGNPAPVLDRYDARFTDGRIFLFYNNGIASEHATRMGNGLRTVLYKTSIDHGITWSESTDITSSVHRPYRPEMNKEYKFEEDWRSYANTPGHALQLQKGKYAGRIFVPANHSIGVPQNNFNDYRAHAFYSDDHGKTWQLSPSIEVPSSNESIAVELSDGTLMQNIRHQSGIQKERLVALSRDGGESWTSTYFDSVLISPVCQSSILSYTMAHGKHAILFSNPESKTNRQNMTVKMSLDDGKSWPIKRVVRAGESAYSDLVEQKDSSIGLLYEHGNDGGIHYANFNMAWLLGGKNYNDSPWIQKALGTKYVQSSVIPMSRPIAQFKSSLFSSSMPVQLVLNHQDSKIHYTLDGSEPSQSSEVFLDVINIKNSCTLKAKAFHPKLKPSKTIALEFLKASHKGKIKDVSISPKAHKSYKGGGGKSLFDMNKGTTNFREKHWMGFNGDDVEIHVVLEEAIEIKNITLSTITAHDSWIFLPHEIAFESNGFQTNLRVEVPKNVKPTSLDFIKIPIEQNMIKEFTIIIQPVKEMPVWHQGKGTPAWFFIDEILID